MSAYRNAGVTELKPASGSKLDEFPVAEGAAVAVHSAMNQRPTFSVSRRIDVWGEVDFASAESFRSALCEVIPSSGVALINMGGLEFIDSAGVRALVTTANSFPAVEFRLESTKPSFVKLWQLLASYFSASNVRFCAGLPTAQPGTPGFAVEARYLDLTAAGI